MPEANRIPALVLVTLLAPAAAAQAPPPETYAWGWEIATMAPAGFHEFELGLEVYRSVADPQLRDLGVYDALGEPVPRFVGPPPTPEAADELERPLVPLAVFAPAGVAIADMRLALEQSGEGTRVRIESVAGTADPQPAATLRAYLVDLGEESEGLRALQLAWPAEAEPFLLQLTVEGSLDLDRWSVIGTGTVAGLREGEAKIERRRVEVQPRRLRYLRISWRESPAAWRLTGFAARFGRAAPEEERDWTTLSPANRDAEDGGLLFDLGGAPPVDRVGLELPAGNGLLRGTIHCRAPGAAHWRLAYGGLFYRIEREGGSLASEPAGIAARRCAQWKLLIERGDRDAPVSLRLGWRPDRVLFVAQGAGPWRLVAGRAADAGDDYPQERLYSDAGMRQLAEEAGGPANATLGPRQELGGALSLEPPAGGTDWRRRLLWLGLGLGVLLVAAMAVSLARALRG